MQTEFDLEDKAYFKNNKIFKRLYDIFFSIIGLVVSSPIFLITAIAIKVDSKGPVFFKQKRVGQYEKPFYIYKFRTMVSDAEKLGGQITIGRDNRITKVGNFLRKFKLDELPQLINVLKGEMSFVGPRPEVEKYVNLYSKEQRRVFEAKPGITDMASIEYRNENEILGEVEDPEKYYIEVIMPDKLSLNIKYIEKNNIFIDTLIIIKTIFRCL